jgi:hypothetical protein
MGFCRVEFGNPKIKNYKEGRKAGKTVPLTISLSSPNVRGKRGRKVLSLIIVN